MFKIRTAKLDQTNIRGTSQAINRDVGNFLDPLLEGVCDMGNHLDGLAEVFTLACKMCSKTKFLNDEAALSCINDKTFHE